MDELLRQRSSMDAMLFHTFQDNDIGDDAHIIESLFESLKSIKSDDACIIESFFESLKSKKSTPLFKPIMSKYTQLGTTILLYKLKEKYVMYDTCY